jgi:hypothetical protein
VHSGKAPRPATPELEGWRAGTCHGATGLGPRHDQLIRPAASGNDGPGFALAL